MGDRKEKLPSAAAIHDLSGAGKCSLTVILPVLSVCGVETSVMPTAVLSTHTGGFEGFTYRDLTDDLLPMARHWKRYRLSFGALYSGFLGSERQISAIEEIFSEFRTRETLILVDPVMGDNGRLYRTYTQEMAEGMKRLCKRADLITPNMTEACHLLGRPYRPGPYREREIEEILQALCRLGPSKAVLTGVCFDTEKLGAACLEKPEGRMETFLLPRVEGSYHGTGDLFSAALLGGLLNKMSLPLACKTAVEFTHRCIVSTRDSGEDPRFGPKFEPHLPSLGRKMEDYRKKIANS